MFLKLVMLVAATKKPLEKQALVAGTKQSRQAVKTHRLTRLPGLQGSQACLLCFVPATGALVFEVGVLQTNMC